MNIFMYPPSSLRSCHNFKINGESCVGETGSVTNLTPQFYNLRGRNVYQPFRSQQKREEKYNERNISLKPEVEI